MDPESEPSTDYLLINRAAPFNSTMRVMTLRLKNSPSLLLRSLLLNLILVTSLFVGAVGNLFEGQAEAAQEARFRGAMGFSAWPPDLTKAAQIQLHAFLKKNATLTVHHLDGGVPWQEALKRTRYSRHLRRDWASRRRGRVPGAKVFLAITPINFSRNGLAANWQETDNLPLPNNWKNRAFNDRRVKRAFTNYALEAVRYFKPDYLAIGIESNLLITNAIDKWPAYLELNAHVYKAVKRKHPGILVFPTVQYESLRGVNSPLWLGSIVQTFAMFDLMKHSDILALSTYRYGFDHNGYAADYFNPALQYNKPIAIAEMGAISKTTMIGGRKYRANQQDQFEFLKFVLDNAARNDFVFAVNWLAIDFNKMMPKLPPLVRRVARAWVHTGLLNQNGRSKKAYRVWKSHLPPGYGR